MEQNMKLYDYFLYEDNDAYGQPKLSKDVKGQVKMAIGVASQTVQDSVAYSGTQYTALTNAAVSDKMVIRYGVENLKVLYVNPLGRYKQVYLARM
jgi:hypothetical protein